MLTKPFISRSWMLIKRYLPQISISMIFLLTATVLAEFVTPKPHPVPDSPLYKHAYTFYETVPFLLLVVTCVVIPCILVISYTVATKDLRLFVCTASMLLVGFGSCLLITEMFKLGVRRARPYALYEVPLDMPRYKFYKEMFDKQMKKEGFKSFPSGHTSNGICGTLMLFWFFTGQANLRTSKRSVFLSIAIEVVLFFGVSIGAGVAATRVVDNRHHLTDVLIGALIGAICSSFSYFVHFNSVWSEKSNLPRLALPNKTQSNSEA